MAYFPPTDCAKNGLNGWMNSGKKEGNDWMAMKL